MQTTRSLFRHFALCTMLASVPSRIVHAADDTAPSLSAELVSLLLPLGLVIATLFAAFFLLRRRFGLSTREGPLKVAQVIAVGPRERIVLIEHAERKLVIGVTSQQITTLATFENDRTNDRAEIDFTQ
jgi:flagellar protein FliO/FliZ